MLPVAAGQGRMARGIRAESFVSMRFHSPVGTADVAEARAPGNREASIPKPPEGATGKARCNFVPDQPWIWAPAIMRLLSPLTGLCLVGTRIFQGLTPLATAFRPLRGLPAWSGVSWSWPGEHRPTETSSVVAWPRRGGTLWSRTPPHGDKLRGGGRTSVRCQTLPGCQDVYRTGA